MDMTVSAALRRIKKIKGLIAERTRRAEVAAIREESKVPAFAFGSSVEERAAAVRDLIALQTAVAVSNATTKISSGVLVAQAVRTLDEIKAEIAFLVGLKVRAMKSEIDVEEDFDWNPNMTSKIRVERKKTWLSAITQAERAKLVEDLTSQFERLNNEVEASNNRVSVSVETSK